MNTARQDQYREDLRAARNSGRNEQDNVQHADNYGNNNVRNFQRADNYNDGNDQMQKHAQNANHVGANRYADNHFRVRDNQIVDHENSQNEEQQHRERLNQARQSSRGNKGVSTAESAMNLAKNANPFGALSLLKQIDMLNDMPYFAAIGAAVFKDISDFVGIGSLPGIGTVITICCSIFIGMMMFLGGSGEKRKAAKGWMKKILALIGGTIVEILPGIDFIPAETITAGMVYVWTLSDRKSAEK